IWGEVMNGTDEGDGWLKVGRYFLPMIINGTPVLTQCADSAHQASRAPAALKKPRKPRNVYRYMLQNITKDGEIDLVFNGLVRLLSTVYKANQTYLPNSVKSIGFYQEALVLLWHLLTLNPTFTKRVVDHLDTNQILLPVLYLLQQ
ncbi:unnamed protein product, partial [Polarella glacialis]